MPKISYAAIRRKAVDNQSEKFVALVQGGNNLEYQ
jgi:hypothetical protein